MSSQRPSMIPNQSQSYNQNSSIACLVHSVYGPFIAHHVKILQVAELMPCMRDVMCQLRGANTQELAWRIFDQHLKNSRDTDKYEQLTSALQCQYKVLVCALNCGPVNFNQQAHSKMISMLTPDMVDTFMTSEVAEQLAIRGVLTLHHYEFIKRLEFEGQKAEACFLLVDLLARQHENWYEHLLEVLSNCRYCKLVLELEPNYYQRTPKLPTARLSHVGQIPSNSDVSKARLCLPRQFSATRQSTQAASATMVADAGSFGQRVPQPASYGCDRESGRCTMKESHVDLPRSIPLTGHASSHEAWKPERDVGKTRCVKFDIPIASCASECLAKTDKKEMQSFEVNHYGKDSLNGASSWTNHDFASNYHYTDSKVENNFTAQQERTPQKHASLHLYPATESKSRSAVSSQSTCPCQKENPVDQSGFINYEEAAIAQPSYTNREQNTTYRQSYVQPQNMFPTSRSTHTDAVDHVISISHHLLGPDDHVHNPTTVQFADATRDSWSFQESEQRNNAMGQTSTANHERNPNSHQMYVNVNLKRNTVQGRNQVPQDTWRAPVDNVQSHIGTTEPTYNYQPVTSYQEPYSFNEPSFVPERASMYKDRHSTIEPSFARDRTSVYHGDHSITEPSFVKDKHFVYQEHLSTNEPSFAKDRASMYQEYPPANEPSYVRSRHVSTSGQVPSRYEQGAESDPGCPCHQQKALEPQSHYSYTVQPYVTEAPQSGAAYNLRELNLSGVCREDRSSQSQTQTNSCELNCNLRGYISLLEDPQQGYSTGHSSSYQRHM